MNQAALFMRGVGGFYLLNLVLLWPSIWSSQLPTMYPGVDLHIGEPIFDLLLNAWLAVGLGLCAIGLVLLWAARQAAHNLALIMVVVFTETLFLGWDIYSALNGYQAITVAVVTVIIHGLIIVWALRVMRTQKTIAE